MAVPGQLKTKIDLLKKKIAEKATSLTPERRRQLHKRLRRLQRSRRVALTAEKKRHPAPAAKPSGEAAAAPGA